MPKVLILDADCPAGVETVQSLGRAGAEVHVASAVPDALVFHSRYCAFRHQQPSHPEAILAWANDLDSQHHFDLVVPTTERALLAFAVPACPAEMHRKAVIASRDSILHATNKESVWQLADTLGIPVPPSVLASASEKPSLPFQYPVAVKPVHSKQMDGDRLLDLRVSYAHNEEELTAILDASPALSFQVQKLVRGRGVGIEVLFDHGKPVWHFAHERLHELPLTGGGSSYRKSIAAPPDLLQHSIALLTALQWHGVAMVEWKVDPADGAYLMEINPRLWGSLALAIDAGVDFPRGLLAIAMGNSPGAQVAYKFPYYTRDFTRDLDWQIANLRADRSNPQLLTRPWHFSILELLRPLALRESWDYFDAADLGLTARRLTAYFTTRLRNFAKKLLRRSRRVWFLRSTHPRVVKRICASERPQRILFLCQGNICRSPLAEIMTRNALPGHSVTSAGFHPNVNRSSPAKMQRSALDMGIDMSAHRSRWVTADEVNAADLVLVMDWKNYAQLMRDFPQARDKTTFLGLFADAPRIEIEDPYSLEGEQLCKVVQQIASATHGLHLLLVDHTQPHTVHK